MDFNRQREKKRHKLAEAENVLETIMESNKNLNSIVHHENTGNKKYSKREKGNARKKKLTDCEIIESNTVEKSDNNVNSNTFYKKKRKHKVINDDNISDCRILEIDIQDLENNTSIEIPKELYQHSKKHKNNSLGEIENVSNYRTKKSGITENNKILDELYKRKRHDKQTEFDNMSDCLNTDLNGIELSQNNFNSKAFSSVHKQKRRKLVTAENLPKTANIESNYISINTVFHEGVDEGFMKISDSQTISKLSRKNNRHSETKAENCPKEKYKSIVTNEFDCEINEPAATEKSDNNANSNKFLKKKRKHKRTDDENVLECRIAEAGMQELEKDTNIKCLRGKKVKHRLLGKIENIFNQQESATGRSGKNIVLDVLEVQKREDNYKQTKVDKRSDLKTAESKDIEINQNSLNTDNLVRFNEKKNKQKLLDEMENISGCKTADSNPIEINQNSLNTKNVVMFNEKKKKKHKHKLLDKMENISDCKTADSNPIEINQNDLNSENVNTFREKKKKKHKLFDEIEIIYDCKTVESNAIEINQNDLNCENVNTFRKKKKKKHKHKLLEEIESIYDCKTADSNPFTIIQNENVSKVHEKKKKHKLLDKMENISDCKIADSNHIEINQNDLNSENVNRFYEKKNKKHKHKLLDEIEIIYDCKTADSNNFEINQNDLNSENVSRFDEIENISDCKIADSNPIEINQNDFKKIHKKKKKKYRHKLFSEMENTCKDNIQVSAVDEGEKNRILDTLGVQKRNKCKSSDADKICDHEIKDSNAIEINQNDLSTETFNRLHKAKRKKRRHNLAELESMPKTVTESNNIIYHEHSKKDSERNTMQNLVVEIPPKTNKKYMESRIEMLSDNLQKKEKNVSCKKLEETYQADAYISFDPFINDMADVPISFPVPLLHEGETVCSIAPERRDYLEKNGVTILTGKWTKTEDDILTRNFQQFGLDFGVNNPFQLLGINQNKKDDKLDKFKRAKHFLIRLGKDLDNRSLRSIYMRARNLLTPLKNKRKLSAEEAVDLKHAHQLVGNKWTRISDMLSRSDNTCHTAFRWHKSDISKGKWTAEEKNNLIKAIKTVSGADDISANNLKNISWKAVAKYVPTRNEFQCHKQWAEHLAWDSSVTEKKQWERFHYGKLIYLLKERYCFNSEHEINWRELHKHFNDVAPSYIFLHKKWFYLKGRLPKGFDFNYSMCLDAFKRMYEEEYKIFENDKL